MRVLLGTFRNPATAQPSIIGQEIGEFQAGLTKPAYRQGTVRSTYITAQEVHPTGKGFWLLAWVRVVIGSL